MTGQHIEQIREIYQAFGKGDMATVLAAFDERIEWREAEGNPYRPDGSPWVGPQAILTNLFMRLGSEWESFTVTPVTFDPTADGALVQGRYTGRFKATGTAIDCQFAHLWRLRDGKVVAFQQFVDTAQWQRAMGTTTEARAAGR